MPGISEKRGKSIGNRSGKIAPWSIENQYSTCQTESRINK